MNDPNDRGGATKYGVSLRWLVAQGHMSPADAALFDIDHNRVLDWRDIAGMTLAQAEGIIYDHFWLKTDVYTLPSPFDGAVFDQVFNAGEVAAFKMLQRALNATTAAIPDMKPLAVDGLLGSGTRGRLLACAAVHPTELIAAYRDQAANRYRAIVVNDRTQQKWLNGWLRRASELGNV